MIVYNHYAHLQPDKSLKKDSAIMTSIFFSKSSPLTIIKGGVAAAFLCLGVLSGCNQGGAQSTPPTPPALPVNVVTPTLQRVPIIVEAVGQTQGSKEVEIRARVSGILQKQRYTEGDPVRTNAVLFEIDRAPFEIALAQAKAQLAQEKARGEQAKREESRLRPLAQTRAISQKDYDDALSAYQLSEASIQLAQAKVREAELNLSYTAVTAPIAGITGRAQRSEGSLVTAGTDSLLTTLTQTDPIWVRFSIAEAEYNQLRNASGRRAAVTLVSSDGKPLETAGKLNFAASTVDPKLGTVQLRAEFPNPSLLLLPGQFVRAQVVAGEQEAFLVPQIAVQQGDQGRFVWIVGADGKATQRPVEVGTWLGANWIIRKGLNAGDKVIVDNIIKLRPGAPVQAKAAAAGNAPSTAAKKTS